MRYLIIIFLFVTSSSASRARTTGLVPSTNSLGRAEAVTASSYGTDALFYNPACLVENKVAIKIVGIEQVAGYDEYAIPIDPSDQFRIEDYFSLLSQQDKLSYDMTARAVDISLPYIAISSFIHADISAQKNDGTNTHLYHLGTDTGLIGGFGVRLRKLALGYAQYALVRAQIDAEPTEQQVMTIHDAVLDDSLSEDTVPYRDFTRFTYGGARGHNYGLMWYWWDDNISGIGVSILNANGTTFKDEPPLEREDLKEEEQKLKAEGEIYNIETELPEEIPELVNAGIVLGFGGDQDSIVDLRLGLDYHDIGGDHIEHKFAASYDFGINLPNEAALALSWPLVSTDWAKQAVGEEPSGENYMIHMGLLSLRAFGGYREKTYVARGGGITFHFGVERAVSLLKLSIEGFATEAVENSNHIPQQGMRAELALTLVF